MTRRRSWGVSWTTSKEPVTIVALGPWTNLEDTFAADPALAARVAGIHAMAGAVDAPGNVIVEGVTADDRLEWNVAADPSAVAAVMATTIPITIVPLDATDDVPVPLDLDDQLEPDHAAAGADLTYELLVRSPGRMTDPGQQLWDELAALAVSQPGLVTWQDATLTIAPDGRLDRSPGGRPVRVATAADRTATDAALLAGVATGCAADRPLLDRRDHRDGHRWLDLLDDGFVDGRRRPPDDPVEHEREARWRAHRRRRGTASMVGAGRPARVTSTWSTSSSRTG